MIRAITSMAHVLSEDAASGSTFLFLGPFSRHALLISASQARDFQSYKPDAEEVYIWVDLRHILQTVTAGGLQNQIVALLPAVRCSHHHSLPKGENQELFSKAVFAV